MLNALPTLLVPCFVRKDKPLLPRHAGEKTQFRAIPLLQPPSRVAISLFESGREQASFSQTPSTRMARNRSHLLSNSRSIFDSLRFSAITARPLARFGKPNLRQKSALFRPSPRSLASL